jgi:hypothetical protein
LKKTGYSGPVEKAEIAASILLWRMAFVMALKVTPAVKYTGILVLQSPRHRIRAHDGRIKIYQVAVVKTCALNGADAMSIMTY